MHRDVKPHNVMIDHEHRKVRYFLDRFHLIIRHHVASSHRLGPG